MRPGMKLLIGLNQCTGYAISNPHHTVASDPPPFKFFKNLKRIAWMKTTPLTCQTSDRMEFEIFWFWFSSGFKPAWQLTHPHTQTDRHTHTHTQKHKRTHRSLDMEIYCLIIWLDVWCLNDWATEWTDWLSWHAIILRDWLFEIRNRSGWYFEFFKKKSRKTVTPWML